MSESHLQVCAFTQYVDVESM